ncbi:MAG TPA: hypothetical protein VG759_08125 [Candidatus Angelobacter sp.]|jgi:hypothetical protein|nr:hypothetical protein [Candidatus Angelobacter sp.]
MKHLTEKEIVLHCFGDAEHGAEIDQHLNACSECRETFEQVKALLASIEPAPVPDPHESLEQKMWLKLRDRLPEKRPGLLQRIFPPRSPQARWATAGAMAVLVLAAFIAGRFWPRGSEKTNSMQSAQIDPQRVVLVAVGDHLERSQMLLVEIMHTDSKRGVDLSREQAQARDLLDANHLYRLSASKQGDPSVQAMLDQLERVLAEIANSPRDLTQSDLREIQDQVQSQGLLFKIRVIGSKVRQEEMSSRKYSENQRL